LHTTHFSRTIVKEIQYKIDVNTLSCDNKSKVLGLNEVARLKLRTTEPLFCDSYRQNRTTGSFILIDEGSHNTVGAGMVI